MWEAMWSKGLGKGQAFDVGGVSQTLAGELARRGAVPKGLSALVPGCGRAYDALALARSGYDRVVAIDLSPTACTAAKDYLAEVGDEKAKAVEVICGDFFEHTDKYDLIWVPKQASTPCSLTHSPAPCLAAIS